MRASRSTKLVASRRTGSSEDRSTKKRIPGRGRLGAACARAVAPAPRRRSEAGQNHSLKSPSITVVMACGRAIATSLRACWRRSVKSRAEMRGDQPECPGGRCDLDLDSAARFALAWVMSWIMRSRLMASRLTTIWPYAPSARDDRFCFDAVLADGIAAYAAKAERAGGEASAGNRPPAARPHRGDGARSFPLPGSDRSDRRCRRRCVMFHVMTRTVVPARFKCCVSSSAAAEPARRSKR